jgi:hypothetical protein
VLPIFHACARHSRRAHRGSLPGILIILGALLIGAGCASTGSVPPGDDGSWPRLSERVLDTDLFLEVAEPEPASLAVERAQLDAWRAADYAADRKRGMQELVMPESYRLTLEEFRANPGQDTASGPYLVLQLREREKVEGVKEHLVETRSMFSGEATQGVKKVKVWRRWRWEPGKATIGNEVVNVVAIEHEFSPGVFSRYSGTLDENGTLRFDLAPLLRAGASQVKGTTIVLQISCPARKKLVEVRVELEAILHYQQSIGDQ